MEQNIIIDGSKYEGGGQMIRNSLVLSTLLQKQFKMINIRCNRPNPGINNQLKNQIDLIAPLVDADVIGNKIGSQIIEFIPKKKFQENQLLCKATSAQSITLILQSLLPIALFGQEGQCQLKIQGGTFVNHSPSIWSWNLGFVSYLKEMGLQIEVNVEKEGYYPQGGGIVNVQVTRIKELNSFTILKQSKIERAQVLYLVGGNNLNKQKYDEIIEQRLQIPIQSDIKITNSKKFKKCYGICLMTFSPYNRYDHSQLSDVDMSVDELLEIVLSNSQKELKNPGVLDQHLQDQFIIFMALAKGESVIQFNQPTDHTKSALYVVKKFIPKIDVSLEELEENRTILKIKGIGYNY